MNGFVQPDELLSDRQRVLEESKARVLLPSPCGRSARSTRPLLYDLLLTVDFLAATFLPCGAM